MLHAHLAGSKEGLHSSLKVGLVGRARGLSRGPWGHLPHACMAPRGHGEHDPRKGPSWNEARLGGRYGEAVRLTDVWWWIGVHGRQSHAVPSLRWPLLGMPLPHGPLQGSLFQPQPTPCKWKPCAFSAPDTKPHAITLQNHLATGFCHTDRLVFAAWSDGCLSRLS